MENYDQMDCKPFESGDLEPVSSIGVSTDVEDLNILADFTYGNVPESCQIQELTTDAHCYDETIGVYDDEAADTDDDDIADYEYDDASYGEDDSYGEEE